MEQRRPHPTLVLAGTSALSLTLSLVVWATAGAGEAGLGAPLYWTWALTGIQVLSLWAAGTKRWWGWPVGAAVQPAWIAYALLTGQVGFIPGCAISAIVQAHSFMSRRRPGPVIESLAPAGPPWR